MKKMINQWHNVSVYLAGAAALVAILVPMDITARLLWASISILFLHFFEEFGAPGGFPYMGMKVLMGSSETNKTKWSCNNLSSMFGKVTKKFPYTKIKMRNSHKIWIKR